MDKVFKAIADATRRKILELLRDRDMTAGEIAGHFDLTKPTLSRHFAVLREAGLVEDEKAGRHITYRLNAPVLEDALTSLMDEYNFVWVPPCNVEASAQEFLRCLLRGDFHSAARNFDSQLAALITPEKLGDKWRELIERYGRFVRQADTRTDRYWKYTAAIITCEFGRTKINIKVVFSKSGQISGLWFLETE